MSTLPISTILSWRSLLYRRHTDAFKRLIVAIWHCAHQRRSIWSRCNECVLTGGEFMVDLRLIGVNFNKSQAWTLHSHHMRTVSGQKLLQRLRKRHYDLIVTEAAAHTCVNMVLQSLGWQRRRVERIANYFQRYLSQYTFLHVAHLSLLSSNRSAHWRGLALHAAQHARHVDCFQLCTFTFVRWQLRCRTLCLSSRQYTRLSTEQWEYCSKRSIDSNRLF